MRPLQLPRDLSTLGQHDLAPLAFKQHRDHLARARLAVLALGEGVALRHHSGHRRGPHQPAARRGVVEAGQQYHERNEAGRNCAERSHGTRHGDSRWSLDGCLMRFLEALKAGEGTIDDQQALKELRRAATSNGSTTRTELRRPQRRPAPRKSATVTRRSRSWPRGLCLRPGLRPLTSLREVSLRRTPSNLAHLRRRRCAPQERDRHSTVTLLARFLGLSTSVPRAQAVWYASSCSGTTCRIGLSAP